MIQYFSKQERIESSAEGVQRQCWRNFRCAESVWTIELLCSSVIEGTLYAGMLRCWLSSAASGSVSKYCCRCIVSNIGYSCYYEPWCGSDVWRRRFASFVFLSIICRWWRTSVLFTTHIAAWMASVVLSAATFNVLLELSVHRLSLVPYLVDRLYWGPWRCWSVSIFRLFSKLWIAILIELSPSIAIAVLYRMSKTCEWEFLLTPKMGF